MSTENNCLGSHLPSFKHCNSDVALDFEDFRIFYSVFLFCNFKKLGIFSCGLGKKDTIFNWEYDPIMDMK